jgi:hypothetical protein
MLKRPLLCTLAVVTLLAIPACVSPPRAVGPTTMAGSLPPPSEGQTALAERAPGATDGPLRIIAPRFIWTHASATEATYAWDCTVENPGDEGFRVTIVVHFLDATGRRLASDNQSVSVSGNSRTAVRGEGLLEADQSAAVSSWRVEYWVEPRVTSD